MIEIRIHGRGGQGNVVAAYLLASAAIEEGFFAQAFPAFGAERRGAPVAAFVRISPHEFRRRDQVANPNYLIVQDRDLLQVPGLLDGLKDGGALLVNATNDAVKEKDRLPEKTQTVAATSLAIKHLGKPVPNTALLASFLSLTQILPIHALSKALAKRFTGDVLDANLSLIEAAATLVEKGAWEEVINAASA